MHRRPLAAILPFAQLDEVPVVVSRLMVWILAHPDGDGAGIEMDPLGGRLGWTQLLLVGVAEDVPEEGLQDGHAAAYETGVDFDDAGGEGLG